MKKYLVERLSFNSISEIPDSWSKKDYVELLSKMSYANPEEITDAELKDMCLMSIADLSPNEAAQVVLEYLIKDKMKDAQIENLAHQMMTEKLWEENPELSLHQDFFKATQLLYTAYNGKFPKTEAVKFQVKISSEDAENLTIFDQAPDAPLVRLLAEGMSDKVLIKRLFTEQLKGTSFEDAKNILWQRKILSKEKNSIVFEIVSSAYWLDDFKFVDSYEAETHEDLVLPEVI